MAAEFIDFGAGFPMCPCLSDARAGKEMALTWKSLEKRSWTGKDPGFQAQP